MHELPRELTRSLRSYRGSVGHSPNLRASSGDPPASQSHDQDYPYDQNDYGHRDDAASRPRHSGDQDVPSHHYHRRSYSPSPHHRRHPRRSDSVTMSDFPSQQQMPAPHDQRHSGNFDAQGHPLSHASSPFVSSVSDDPEKGLAVSTQPSHQQQPKAPQTPQTPKTPAQPQPGAISRQPTKPDIDPAAARNASNTSPLPNPDFYELIGMKAPTNGQAPKNLEAGHGLYGEMRQQERTVSRRYRVLDIVISIGMLVQLLLSAIFIILGSLNIDHHITITVLGAIATFVSGALALVKGQGLPNRWRMTRDELRRVIFMAEELYWDVGAGRVVLYSDIKKLREDYLKVVENAAKNHPDTWTAAQIGDISGSVPGTAAGGQHAHFAMPHAMNLPTLPGVRK